MSGHDEAGPVLLAGTATEAVIAAIRQLNGGARVVDHGSYLRVLAPGRCRVTRVAIEHHTGTPFRLPADLEPIMPSFQGRFTVSEDEASWE